MKKQKVLILGSTGSIGTQALKIIDQFPDKFEVVGLSAGNNIDLLLQQANKYDVKDIAISALAAQVDTGDIELTAGPDSSSLLVKKLDFDIVINSIVGSDGLASTIETLKKDKTLALANKESLVAGGSIVMDLLKSGGRILPVDSEHSALFQCLEGERIDSLKEMILTASGGPFFGRGLEEMKGVTVEQALKHPNWSMGSKITIDSATLINKGLEVLEANVLFGVPLEKIKVLVHRQSIVHGIVSFTDGAFKAVMGVPDMRIPIAYALNYPERMHFEHEELDLAKVARLDFAEPDLEVFKGLALAYEAGRAGKTYPAVYSAANESAVEAFLAKRINFLEITGLVESALEKHKAPVNINMDAVLEADNWAKTYVRNESYKRG